MTDLKQVYRCNQCGNIVEIVRVGAGELICCGEPMELQVEKSQEEGKEKHLPMMKKEGGNHVVKVGSELHPMEVEHHIEWIELIADGKLMARKFLSPGEKPIAEFFLRQEPQQLEVRAYCNLHNLWKVTS